MRSSTGSFAALVLALLAGCSSGGSGSVGSTAAGSTSPAPAPTPTPTAPPHTAWSWWSGDFHVHTDHSGDGVDTVAQSADLARLMGLDFVVLSDHDTLSQTRDPGFVSTPDLELVEGMEWTALAHAGLIGVSAVPPKLPQAQPAAWHSLVQDLIGDAHAQGGVAILYHPAWNNHGWVFPVRQFDAIEVWNNFWTLSDTGLHPTNQRDVDDAYANSGMRAAGLAPSAEVLDMVQQPGGGNDRALYYWESYLQQGLRVAAVGGSDRHKLTPPGYPTTWILSPGKTQAEVLDAVRRGRTMVTAGPEGPYVDLEADADGDGVFEATLGDDVPPGTIQVRVRIRGAAGGKARLIQNRRVAGEYALLAPDHTFTQTVSVQAGDWIRVDVFQPVDWSLPYANQALGGLPVGSTPSAGQVQTLINLWGVSLALGTNRPVFIVEERYRRILNVNLSDLRFSRAALTSPIYVR